MQVSKEEEKLHFVISDYGKGIKEDVKNRLFKEMITTKGKNGTGLGLYMSYSTIKGMFRGDMWVESTVGEGTDFHIKVLLYDERKEEEAEEMTEENANESTQAFAGDSVVEVSEDA